MRITAIPFFTINPPPPRSTLFPYTTLFRSKGRTSEIQEEPPVTPEPEKTLWASESGNVVRSFGGRSEEHTSELQSHSDLVCRLLLEKKKKHKNKESSKNYV